MRRCFTSYVTREMQIKHGITVYVLEWPKSLTASNSGENVGHRNSHSLLVRMQDSICMFGDNMAISSKTKHPLMMQTMVLLGIYLQPCSLVVNSKKLKMYVHTQTCTWVFITAYEELPILGSNQDLL
jgi:hypothetical protein